MDLNININIDAEGKVGEPEIKRKKRKLKNGEETILELPNRVEGMDKPKGVLDLMGL